MYLRPAETGVSLLRRPAEPLDALGEFHPALEPGTLLRLVAVERLDACDLRNGRHASSISEICPPRLSADMTARLHV